MISENLARQVATIAGANMIDPAALLSIVEVETAGQPLEHDGRTPTFLFERHYFYRVLKRIMPSLLARAVALGLAIPKWSRATQYRDEKTSAGRLALLAKARAIDEECADRSCSWGLGQTMGDNCRDLGFGSAVELVDFMVAGGVPAQLDCMVREIKHLDLVGPLNRREFVTVARKYNGKGEAANHYHDRLADAYRRWSRQGMTPAIAGDGLPAADVKAAQRRLRELGFAEVGNPDGRMGSRTVGAISAFQAHENLPVTGKLDDATRAALAAANMARPIAPDRANATAADLRQAGSRTIAAADHVGLAGKIKTAAGTVLAGGAGAEKLGLLDQASDATDKLDQAKGVVGTISDLVSPVFSNPAAPWIALALIVLGVLVWRAAAAITAARVDDHNTGVHAGPADEAGA